MKVERVNDALELKGWESDMMTDTKACHGAEGVRAVVVRLSWRKDWRTNTCAVAIVEFAWAGEGIDSQVGRGNLPVEGRKERGGVRIVGRCK